MYLGLFWLSAITISMYVSFAVRLTHLTKEWVRLTTINSEFIVPFFEEKVSEKIAL